MEVVPPEKKEPAHTVPSHAKEPLPMNPTEIVKPPLRIRASCQLLRYPEVACDRALAPVAPPMGVTSLDEAVGSNTVLGLWDLQTMRDYTKPVDARHMRRRLWYDSAIPALLGGMPEGLESEPGKLAAFTGPEGDDSWSTAVEVLTPAVPHPYRESTKELAEDTKAKRHAWESRLKGGVAKVNSMIRNPALKLID